MNRSKVNQHKFKELEFFFQLAEHSSDLIAVLDTEYKTLYVSPSTEKLLGWKHHEMLGVNPLIHCHNEDLPLLKEKIAKLYESPSIPQTMVARFIDKSEEWKTFEIVAQNYLEDERIKGFVLHAKDITEKNYAQNESILLRRALQYSINAIAITDPRLHENPIIYINPAFERMTGYTKHDIIGSNLRILNGEETNKKDLNTLKKCIKYEKECNGTILNYKKDGSTFWNQIIISPVFDANKKLINYINIFQDVTNSKKIQEEKELYDKYEKIRLDTKVVFSENKSLDVALNKTTQILSKNLEVSYARIWLFNHDENTLDLHASAGALSNSTGILTKVPIGDFKVGQIAQEKVPHLSNNVLDDPKFGNKAWAKKKGIIAFAGYPLLFNNKLLGVIAITSKRQFSHEILKFLSTIAETISFGIENYNNKSELLLSEKKLKFLDEAGKLLNSGFDYSQALLHVPELIVPEFADWCTIYISGNAVSTEHISFAAPSKKQHESFQKLLKEDTNTAEFIRFFGSEQTKISFSPAKEELKSIQNPKLKRFLENCDIKSVLSIPLKVRGNIIGYLIYLSSKSKKIFDAHDATLAEELAQRTAIAVDNAQLYLSAQTEIQNRKIAEKEIILLNQKLSSKVERQTRQLHKAEARFLDMYHSSQDGIMFTDLLGEIQDVNEAFEELMGYPRSEIICKKLEFFTPQSFSNLDNRILKKILETGHPAEYEKQLLHKSGKFISVSITKFIIRDSMGEPQGLCGIIRDITENKRAQEALAEAEERYRTIVTSLKEGILLQDAEGKILEVNKSALEILSLKTEEIIGKTLSELPLKIIFENGSELPETFSDAITISGGTSIVGVTKDNHITWLHVNWEPIYKVKGESPVATVTSFTDITERKKSEEKLTELNNQLERSNKELMDFASVASHDLQEPLRKVQTFGDRLKSKDGTNLSIEGKDYLERMLNAAGRMRGLINDLLAFSRITTKAQPFIKADLNKIVEEVLSDLEISAEEAGAIITVDQLPSIECDPTQIRQLLQNLISNALKFRGKEVTPNIDISSTIEQGISSKDDGFKKAEFCTIIVKDNGIGFDEKYLDKIFNVFQRLHTREEYEGTGVGLAVCRKIVERHSGTITATSHAGKGSSFIVRLPLVQTLST